MTLCFQFVSAASASASAAAKTFPSHVKTLWSDWCEMKRKWVNMILGWLYDLALWPHPWPSPWSFKVRVWKALSQECGGRLIMNEKDVSHPFMTMILTCVTMVRCADVPDSDRVTSDVGLPSTYLVIYVFPWYLLLGDKYCNEEIIKCKYMLIHCGLVMPYGNIDLGQHYLR